MPLDLYCLVCTVLYYVYCVCSVLYCVYYNALCVLYCTVCTVYRWEAAKAQMCTALVGLLGALLALGLESGSNLEAALQYVLPFTAGGFLNIALVSLVPDLMKVTLADRA